MLPARLEDVLEAVPVSAEQDAFGPDDPETRRERGPAAAAPETAIGGLWRERVRLQGIVDRAPPGLKEEAFASLVETILIIDRRISRAEPRTLEDLACKVLVAAAALETDGDCAGALMRLSAARALMIDAERIVRRRD